MAAILPQIHHSVHEVDSINFPMIGNVPMCEHRALRCELWRTLPQTQRMHSGVSFDQKKL